MGKFLISAVATTQLLACVLTSGCAGQTKETRKELELLNDKLAILQNDNDRLDERVSALAQQQQVMTKPEPQTMPAGRPPLKVVTLAPSEHPSAAPPANEAPAAPSDDGRVLIAGTGSELTATPVVEPAQAASSDPARPAAPPQATTPEEE